MRSAKFFLARAMLNVVQWHKTKICPVANYSLLIDKQHGGYKGL
jgi:hypothetical protein